MTDTMREIERLKDSVRCMSIVMDDIALELGIEPHDYGDPDLIFDKIGELQAAQADARALVGELATALETCQSSHNSRDYYQQFDEQLVHEALTKAQAFMEGK